MLYTKINTILTRKTSDESLLSGIAKPWEEKCFQAVFVSFHRNSIHKVCVKDLEIMNF